MNILAATAQIKPVYVHKRLLELKRKYSFFLRHNG